MPFIDIKTNVTADKSLKETIKSRMGQAITAIPGKSEGWLMVSVEDKADLWFQGNDSPAAIAEVKVFGTPSPKAMNDLTGRITDTLSELLGVPGDRVYVAYFPTDSWGWNGSNF